MLKLQEDLQTSMARELHDEFGQILTAITMLLGRVKRRAGTAGRDRPIRSCAISTRSTASRSRRSNASARSRACCIRSSSTISASSRRSRGTSINSAVSTASPRTFSTSGVGIVPPDIAIHIYRIVQEALGNASRHARASQAWVRLTQAQGILTLEVEDDGRGLPQWRGEAPAGAGGGRARSAASA